MHPESPAASRKRKRSGSWEVVTLLGSGFRASEDCLTLYWRALEGHELKRKQKKLFFIVGKRALAKACERNRAKRILREIFRLNPMKRKDDFQFAIRIFRRPAQLSTPYFKERLEPLLARALG